MVQPQLVPGRALMGPSLGLVDGVSLSPPEGKCPAGACGPRNETCQRAAQALHNVTCSPASQDRSCSAIPTLLRNLLAPALSCYTHVPQKFPCLLQVFHQPFAKPKAAFASWDISWPGGKTVLELFQPRDWHVCRFAPCSM